MANGFGYGKKRSILSGTSTFCFVHRVWRRRFLFNDSLLNYFSCYFYYYTESGLVISEVPPHYWETPYSQPYFDNSSRREVTATVGQAALLHCRVRNLGDRAVS